LSLGKLSKDYTEKGCWKFSTHDLFDVNGFDEFLRKLDVCHSCDMIPTDSDGLDASSLIYLKAEPFILHAEAKDRTEAHKLLTCALQSGFRNSGCTISDNRCMVAIRHTMGLNCPIAYQCIHGKLCLMITADYLLFLLKQSNALMENNFKRIELLLSNVKQLLSRYNN
jgi:tRNA(Phe) wybutosine-synthesizing methylase Tyw3